jgi:hypothetical protein
MAAQQAVGIGATVFSRALVEAGITAAGAGESGLVDGRGVRPAGSVSSAGVEDDSSATRLPATSATVAAALATPPARHPDAARPARPVERLVIRFERVETALPNHRDSVGRANVAMDDLAVAEAIVASASGAPADSTTAERDALSATEPTLAGMAAAVAQGVSRPRSWIGVLPALLFAALHVKAFPRRKPEAPPRRYALQPVSRD